MLPVALVTGGASGIGYASALALGRSGHTVVIAGRSQERLADAEERIENEGFQCLAVQMDVSRPESVRAGVREVVNRLGRIDVLVTSAGLNPPDRQLDELSYETWVKTIDVNLNGSFACIREVLPVMRNQGGGVIIAVASWAARWPVRASGSAYSAAKAGLLSLMMSINMEEFAAGVRATALCPAAVSTDMLNNHVQPPTQEAREEMLQSADVGSVVSWIAGLPKHVCVNELVVSPVANQLFSTSQTMAFGSVVRSGGLEGD